MVRPAHAQRASGSFERHRKHKGAARALALNRPRRPRDPPQPEDAEGLTMDEHRRRLLFASAGAGMLATVLASCGGGSGYSPPMAVPPPAPPGTLACGATAITANHNHALTIPAADTDSMVAKTYSIMGTATHDHEIMLTPAQLAQIKTMTSVTVISTVGGSPGHTHDVTIDCA
jgi:hypothetical protein